MYGSSAKRASSPVTSRRKPCLGTRDHAVLLHLVVEELEVRVELRFVAGARLEEVRPHPFPHHHRGMSDEVVYEIEIDQPPLEEYSDLVVEREDVRAYVSSTDRLDHRVEIGELSPVDLVERLLKLERVPGRVEPHQEIRAAQPDLIPHLEAVEGARCHDAGSSEHDRDRRDAHPRRHD